MHVSVCALGLFVYGSACVYESVCVYVCMCIRQFDSMTWSRFAVRLTTVVKEFLHKINMSQYHSLAAEPLELKAFECLAKGHDEVKSFSLRVCMCMCVYVRVCDGGLG